MLGLEPVNFSVTVANVQGEGWNYHDCTLVLLLRLVTTARAVCIDDAIAIIVDNATGIVV